MNKGCCIDDGMQDVYEYIQDCDNILIASPIYFSEITGALLNAGSRLQTYFSARFFRKEKPIEKVKKGAVILVGGGDGNMDKAYDTACCLLHHMNAYDILPAVISHDTNNRPAVNDEATLAGVNNIIGIIAPDDEEQDAYIIGVSEPVKEFSGKVIAVIHRNDDIEEKWVVAPAEMSFSIEEIKEQVHFQEQYFDYEVIM